MAFIKRYSSIQKGGISLIGNTLGLSKLSNANRGGLLGSIGAFASLDATLKVNDFPNGTTLDYLKNGSSALLNLPVLSEVLYAELVWGGLYKSAASDISDKLNNSVVFGTPSGNYNITIDTLTRQNIEINLPDISLGDIIQNQTINVTFKVSVN